MSMTKSVFREKCLKKLKKSYKQNKLYKSSLVNRQLSKLLKSDKKLDILFYYPLDMEVDILKVLNVMRKNNNIYIPFMVEQSFKMVPFRLPLKRKKFGIFEAGNSYKNIKNIDIAIVPVIGVDGNLQRVGFGKGMYDRFFDTLKKKPFTIFVQIEDCYTKKTVCDSYDIRCDIYLTPKTYYKTNKKIQGLNYVR